MRKEVTYIDKDVYFRHKPIKLTTHHKCKLCKKYCKVEYVEIVYGLCQLVSSCCKEKTEVKRYVYKKAGKKI